MSWVLGFDEQDEDDEMEMEPASPAGSREAGPLSGEEAQAVPCPEGFSAVLSNLLGGVLADGEFSFGGRAHKLPSAPGLEIDGLGTVALPLCEEQAEKLVALGERAPYGKNFDTLVDESVRKCWQIAPDKVKLLNPEWELNMKALVEEVATRLGFRGIALQFPLYKLLVYGPGGHFVRHKDTEKSDGMFATMVVQLPSLHEGGDLMVFQPSPGPDKEEKEFRHGFGKESGAAPFGVHFAVHYADAEHAVEPVTSGYRIVLVYSICLPDNMRDLDLTSTNNDDANAKSETMARAIKGLVADESDSSFTLFFTHEYTESGISRHGCDALKGDDRARFLELDAANRTLPREHQLQFYLAKLSYDIEYYDASGGFDGSFSWEESKRAESIATWHARSGKKLQYKRTSGTDIYAEPSQKFSLNLLNPDSWTLEQLWGEEGTNKYEGYMGNEGATKSTKYCQYGLVAWPLELDAINCYTYIGEESAAEALGSLRPLSSGALEEFLDAINKVTTHSTMSYPTSETQISVSAEFCITLIDMLDETGDVHLAKRFFEQTFPRVQGKLNLAMPLVALFRKFAWSEVGPAFMECLNKSKPWGQTRFDNRDATSLTDAVQLALQIADSLLLAHPGTGGSEATSALARSAVDRVKTIVWEDLLSCKFVHLWQVVSALDDKSLQNELIAHFDNVDVVYLKTVIESMDVVAKPNTDLYVAFQRIIKRRLEWLNRKVSAAVELPDFSWDMPNASFPNYPEVEAFLRGPEQKMTVRDMNGVEEARAFVAMHSHAHPNASFTLTAGGRGRNAHVVVSKTRQAFNARKHEIVAFHNEAKHLSERFGGDVVPLPTGFADATDAGSKAAADQGPSSTSASAGRGNRGGRGSCGGGRASRKRHFGH